MKRIAALSCCLLGAVVSCMQAQADPSEVFLQAYQTYQSGERFEGEKAPQRALLRYREALGMLEGLARSSPDWQPVVVEYRLKRARESVARLEVVTAGMPPLAEEVEGPLPVEERVTLPAVTTVPAPSPARRATPSPRSDLAEPARPAPGGSQASQRELAAARQEVASLRAENDLLSRQLEKGEANLKSALVEVDKTKVLVVELKSQLAQATDALANTRRDGAHLEGIREAHEKETAEFLKKLAEARADADVLLEENAQIMAKLDKASEYIRSSDEIRDGLVAERDRLDAARRKAEEGAAGQASADLAALREANAALEKSLAEAVAKAEAERAAERESLAAEKERLAAENAALTQKLGEAEKKAGAAAEVEKLVAEKEAISGKLAAAEKKLEEAAAQPSAPATAALQSEFNTVSDRLLEVQAELAKRDARIEQLVASLDETSGELARLKLLPVPTSEEQQLLAENDLLRTIILRQIKVQNQRDDARRNLETELAQLQVQSDEIARQLGVLGAPVLELTAEERTLFKDPVTLLTEPEPAKMAVDIAITQPSAEEAAQNLAPEQPQGAGTLDEGARESVRRAQELFNAGDFSEAERLYQDIVEKAPENYFALANLGAVQIESGKLSAAEVALGKAIKLSPDDSFAQTHLGIAMSRQGRFAEARQVLERAVEINPSDAVAFNYLGVCLAQQGERESSESKLKHSIELDPEYANAHFNLAVLYATAKPPSIELAKEHYRRATELGSAPDASLERLIQ